MDYAAKGGEVCESIGKKRSHRHERRGFQPAGRTEDKNATKNSCDFLEIEGLQRDHRRERSQETDGGNRELHGGVSGVEVSGQVSSYAMYTLGPGQLNDPERLVSYGEKMLAENPNSLPALLLLASYYVDDAKPGSFGKAITYAQKAIEVANADAPDADKSRKLSAGAAHSTSGWAYLKQDKTGGGDSGTEGCRDLLKGQDDQQYARALYGLGFAYGKLNKLTEASEVLTEAVKIPGPLQAMSQELLTKVNAARAKGK